MKISNKTGFTIVELLIVIVVIGILASITVVAFNGIQTRARNSARLAAADSYVKIVKLYDTGSNTLPSTAGVSRYCLSDRSPDLNSDGTKECGEVIGTKPGTYNGALISSLQTIAATLPLPPSVTSKGTIKTYYGPTLEYSADWKFPDGTPSRYILHYWLEGSAQDCRQESIIFDYSASPVPEGQTGAIAVIRPSGFNYSYTNDGTTYCYTPLRLSK